MTSRADALRMPEELTGLAAEAWRDWMPELWKNGHLTDETREVCIRGCRDWGFYSSEHSRGSLLVTDEDGNPALRPENRAAHEAFMRSIDWMHNYGLTWLGRQEMAARGGTIGTQVTPPDDEDDDSGATEALMAELRRGLFQVSDGGAD